MKGFGLSDIEGKWIEENSKKEVSELSEDFYESAASYVLELERELKKSQDFRHKLLKEELKHVLTMIQEIYLLRILKITDALVEEKEPDLLNREREAFEEIRESLESLQEEFVDSVARGEAELEKPREFSNVFISITSDIPEPITGADMHPYGPFEEGEVANIPKKTANLLVDQGLARKIQVKGA